MYQVQMQFIPGNDMIWVARMTSDESIYEYTYEIDAQNQMNLMQQNDPSGRQYRIIFI